ncbi:MAG TPA: response regulator transcription factor [Rhizomicrobium sp.]|nr:response regulator transcription factor [Rhizomicrobium sp.]
MRALLIEDDDAMARSVSLILTGEGFEIDAAALGEDGIALGKAGAYDIVILDLLLPDMNGLDVLRVLRASKVHTPVLVLSGSATLQSKVGTLSAGADDYLTKPFHKDELMARVRAVLRRSQAQRDSMITTGKLTVNLAHKSVEACGTEVKLTVKEYEMLEFLSVRKGVTLTKEAILSKLYGGMEAPEQKIVDVFICKLRKKLAAATNGEHYIKTIWGQGYALNDPSTKVN